MPDFGAIIAAVDPGNSGGIAFLQSDNGYVLGAYPMPVTEKDVAELLTEYAPHIQIAFIEAVHSFPPSIPGNTSRASFTFGKSYGFMRGLLIGMKIPFEEISPQKWTRTIGCVGGHKGTEKKNIHKAKAQQLFPKLKITHAIADALLIAHYGRLQMNGNAPVI